MAVVMVMYMMLLVLMLIRMTILKRKLMNRRSFLSDLLPFKKGRIIEHGQRLIMTARLIVTAARKRRVVDANYNDHHIWA